MLVQLNTFLMQKGIFWSKFIDEIDDEDVLLSRKRLAKKSKPASPPSSSRSITKHLSPADFETSLKDKLCKKPIFLKKNLNKKLPAKSLKINDLNAEDKLKVATLIQELATLSEEHHKLKEDLDKKEIQFSNKSKDFESERELLLCQNNELLHKKQDLEETVSNYLEKLNNCRARLVHLEEKQKANKCNVSLQTVPIDDDNSTCQTEKTNEGHHEYARECELLRAQIKEQEKLLELKQQQLDIEAHIQQKILGQNFPCENGNFEVKQWLDHNAHHLGNCDKSVQRSTENSGECSIEMEKFPKIPLSPTEKLDSESSQNVVFHLSLPHYIENDGMANSSEPKAASFYPYSNEAYKLRLLKARRRTQQLFQGTKLSTACRPLTFFPSFFELIDYLDNYHESPQVKRMNTDIAALRNVDNYVSRNKHTFQRKTRPVSKSSPLFNDLDVSDLSSIIDDLAKEKPIKCASKKSSICQSNDIDSAVESGILQDLFFTM